jgi:hypothetical protein
LNYRPYILSGVNTYFYHKTPEPYFNVLGEVYFSSSLLIQVRAGYIFRKNTSTKEISAPNYMGSTFVNRELTVNLDILYRFFNNIKLGVGGGIVHKLNSQVVLDFTSFNNYYNVEPKILGSLNSMIAYDFGKFELNLRYFYLLNNELKSGKYIRIRGGNYGLSCGVSYRLITSQKG